MNKDLNIWDYIHCQEDDKEVASIETYKKLRNTEDIG